MKPSHAALFALVAGLTSLIFLRGSPHCQTTADRTPHCHVIAEITSNLVDMRDSGMSIEAAKATVSRSLPRNPSTVESTDNYIDMIYANPQIPKSQFVSEAMESCLNAK